MPRIITEHIGMLAQKIVQKALAAVIDIGVRPFKIAGVPRVGDVARAGSERTEFEHFVGTGPAGYA